MTTVLGMGSPFKSDDNVGNIIARKLEGEVAYTEPENFASKDDDFVILDAIDFGGDVGEVRLFRSRDVVAQFATTHNIPVTIFEKLGKKFRIIGVQPKDLSFGEELTPELREKVPEIVSEVKRLAKL